MKKIIIILIAFLSISSATFASVCRDCNLTQWKRDTLIEYFTPCTFMIVYKYRECVPFPNDTVREMEMESINFFGDCSYSGNTAMVVDLATKFVLGNAYRVFNTLNDHSVNKEVSFRMDCCWESNTLEDKVTPCPGGNCKCCAVFDLRRNLDPNSYEYYTYVYQKTNNSPPQTTASCGQGCNYMCNILDNILPGTPLPPIYALPCGNECLDATPWYQSSDQIIDRSVPGTSTCRIIVQYDYRECNGDVIFRIQSFEYIGNDCADDELLWNDAIEGILAELATRYTLPKTFKFDYFTCWQRSTPNAIPPINKTVFKPCDFDACCEATYLVSESLGNPIINSSSDYELDTIGYDLSCGADVSCIFVCTDEFAELPYNQVLNKKALLIEGNIFETSSEVVPNPTKDKVEFFFNSRFSGKVEFSILDNSGKVIYTTDGVIDNGKIRFDFNLKSMPVGVYYYNLKAGLQRIESGKFIKE